MNVVSEKPMLPPDSCMGAFGRRDNENQIVSGGRNSTRRYRRYPVEHT